MLTLGIILSIFALGFVFIGLTNNCKLHAFAKILAMCDVLANACILLIANPYSQKTWDVIIVLYAGMFVLFFIANIANHSNKVLHH